MDNEKSRRTLTAHFVEIQSEQEIQSGVGFAVTVVLQSNANGAYIAAGVGTSEHLAEALKTARAQFIKNLKEVWSLE